MEAGLWFANIDRRTRRFAVACSLGPSFLPDRSPVLEPAVFRGFRSRRSERTRRAALACGSDCMLG